MLVTMMDWLAAHPVAVTFASIGAAWSLAWGLNRWIIRTRPML